MVADSIAITGVSCRKTDEGIPLLLSTGQIRISVRYKAEESELAVRDLQSTAAFDSYSCHSAPQVVTCIRHLLGTRGEPLVGACRTDYPKAKAKPDLQRNSTRAHFFPVFADVPNECLLSALVGGINSPRNLGWIYSRLNLISDRQSINYLRSFLLKPDLPEGIPFNIGRLAVLRF